MLTDLSRSLREEERQAWQRLIRVLGHEINNSLAPIKSIAGSLERLHRARPAAGGLGRRHARGLAVIGSRAEALGRFMAAYARLARLPAPDARAGRARRAWSPRVAGSNAHAGAGARPGRR